MTGGPTQTLVLATRWTGREPPPHLLADSERRHAAGLPGWRRRQWSAARLTAHAALHLAFGTLPPGTAVLPEPDGAPRLLGDASGRCAVSLAHTDDWATCACGPPNRALGVDIEKSDACDSVLLARVSQPGEPLVPGRLATLGWARKEAAFKACRGVPPLLSGYRLTGPAGVAAIRPGRVDRILTTWSFELPGAVLAVAGDHAWPPRLQMLEADEVLDLLSASAVRGRAG